MLTPNGPNLCWWYPVIHVYLSLSFSLPYIVHNINHLESTIIRVHLWSFIQSLKKRLIRITNAMTTGFKISKCSIWCSYWSTLPNHLVSRDGEISCNATHRYLSESEYWVLQLWGIKRHFDLLFSCDLRKDKDKIYLLHITNKRSMQIRNVTDLNPDLCWILEMP